MHASTQAGELKRFRRRDIGVELTGRLGGELAFERLNVR